MTKQEINRLIEVIADKVAEKVIDHLKSEQESQSPEMIDSSEAAKILGISRQYLLHIKDRFSYVKVGENRQSRIFFRKDDLLKNIVGYNPPQKG